MSTTPAYGTQNAREVAGRLLESPKPLLKISQRRVLRQILDKIPPHEAVAGFRKGSSILDFVTPHAGKAVHLRMDLEDFFPSIGFGRVHALFRTAGYPDAVALALTRLCTHKVSAEVTAEKPLSWLERKRFESPHLPQGAPTSPALANLCAFRLDCRLTGLAKSTKTIYTRYADDLLFSCGHDKRSLNDRFATHVAAIVLEEGFRINHRKTRLRHRGQRQTAAGLVLNEKPNISRETFDRLKATLTNCVRHGPGSQNHEDRPDWKAHLQGRIAWVRFSNPTRSAKLQTIYNRIVW